MCYGADLWNLQGYHVLSCMHAKFCKRFLGLSTKAANLAAMGQSVDKHQFLFTHLHSVSSIGFIFWNLKITVIRNKFITCYILMMNVIVKTGHQKLKIFFVDRFWSCMVFWCWSVFYQNVQRKTYWYILSNMAYRGEWQWQTENIQVILV